MFEPKPICNQRFSLRDDSACSISDAEMAMLRTGIALSSDRMAHAIARMLIHLEAITALRLEGYRPGYRDLLLLETMLDNKALEQRSAAEVCNIISAENLANPEALMQAICYVRSLEAVSSRVSPDTAISAPELSHLYDVCCANLETRQSLTISSDPNTNLLLSDICEFISTKNLTPLSQVALMNLQLELLHPFASGSVRMGTLLSNLVLFRWGILDTHIMPLSLARSMRPDAWPQRLTPGPDSTGSSDLPKYFYTSQISDFYANTFKSLLQASKLLKDLALALESKWRSQLRQVGRDSAAEKLLAVLPGTPIITVTTAMRIIDKSLSVTNDAIRKLVSGKILRRIKTRERCRVYVAEDAIACFTGFEKRLLLCDAVAETQTVRTSPQTICYHK